MIASIEYLREIYEKYKQAEKEKIKDHLLKYCELDTLAQAIIIEKMNEIIKS